MTLRQSSPQLGSREKDIIRLQQKKSLCREIPFSGGNVRPGLQEAFGKHWQSAPRRSRRQSLGLSSFAQQTTKLVGEEQNTSQRKRAVGINGRHISFPRGSLCLLQNAAGPRSGAPKSFQALRVPTMSLEMRESHPFLLYSFSACCVPPRNGTLSKAT
ncbi:hypothetical protein E2C01_098008 [Portunus trituberculatus]|uniref:Uncharacterized protein n=1 Tax=Portunus trituberculatus TaxID=210409 RepID=A0A5B7K795_PORTR|nr:hypothetical protein [Portunus trituberculatus]